MEARGQRIEIERIVIRVPYESRESAAEEIQKRGYSIRESGVIGDSFIYKIVGEKVVKTENLVISIKGELNDGENPFQLRGRGIQAHR